MPDKDATIDIPNFNEVQRLQAHLLFLKVQMHHTEMKISILMRESPFWVCDIYTTESELCQ